MTDRVALLRRGARLEGVTVAYNSLEGGVAVVAGLAAGSVALTGFGIDSVIEVASGVVLWWRLRAELGAAHVGPAVEARAARWAGVLLLALAVYIVAESGRRLLTGDRPGESVVGIVLMVLSLIVMPLLARAKLRLAASLGSRALRADAHETIVCAWLSATTLIGLGLNAVLGWWWADPVAALAMVPLIMREGLEAGGRSRPLGSERHCMRPLQSVRQGLVHDSGHDHSRDEGQRCDGADRDGHGERVRQEPCGDRAYRVAGVAPQSVHAHGARSPVGVRDV